MNELKLLNYAEDKLNESIKKVEWNIQLLETRLEHAENNNGRYAHIYKEQLADKHNKLDKFKVDLKDLKRWQTDIENMEVPF